MGFRNGFPLEKTNATVIQLMVPMGHSVVLSKLKIEPGIRVAFPVQFLSKLIFAEKLLWLSRKHSLQKNHQHLWGFLFHFSPAGGKKLDYRYHRTSAFKLFQPITTKTQSSCNVKTEIKFGGSQDCSLCSTLFRKSDLYRKGLSGHFLWNSF